MISYLENNQIDKDAWDSCIDESGNLSPYAYSWFLDIITPGWCALVDHNYRSVFPLPSRQRLGIEYIYIPPFLQCLGLFSKESPDDQLVNEFIGFIPEFYRFIDLSIFNNPGKCTYRVTPRTNYSLSLRSDYKTISNGYSSDCRRNISKALDRKITINYLIDPDEAIALFRQGPGRNISGIKGSDYKRLAELMKYSVSRGLGKVLGVRMGDNLIFSIFYLETPGQITLLFTSTSQLSRDRKTGYMLIDNIIRENSGRKMILDFAGSSIPAVADYIKSFGATPNSYYRLYKNLLPWPFRVLR